MSAEPIVGLQTTAGDAIPLQGVRAQGRLEGLVFEFTVEQRYRNGSPRNIEAIFTFPLPLHAVLLGVELEIGERRLAAVAIARQEATQRYEDALDDGDAAALVEFQGNGLYTVSLGNLMPDESATIRYRYTELLRASGDWLRIAIPTVIAPRYGDPADAGLDTVTTPESDLLTEYPFDLSLEVFGLPAKAWLRSPSHRIDVNRSPELARVTLQQRGFLDRDFVLEIDGGAPEATALVAPDGEGWVVVANPTLKLPSDESRPLALKILLDCSGSMAGDSITAAKRALLELLDQIGEGDHVSLTCFGTRHEFITDGLEAMTATARHRLGERVRAVDATLGGTEMGNALRAVLQQSTAPGIAADVILITDGEIHAIDRVVELAARSNHHLFAIAIGAAPNEALARRLADSTGGACEFVGPTDDAEAAILRTFRRLRSAPREIAEMTWPTLPDWTVTPSRTAFPGDSIPLYAGFMQHPAGQLTLRARDAAGQGHSIACTFVDTRSHRDLLPRLAAARRLASLSREDATALAVRHQLASEYTSFVVVAARAAGEQAATLPNTIRVAQMLAAGWGGTGVANVCFDVGAQSDAALRGLDRRIESCEERPDIVRSQQLPRDRRVSSEARASCEDTIWKPADPEPITTPSSGSPADDYFDPEWAGQLLNDELESGLKLPRTFSDLELPLCLEDWVLERLREIASCGAWSEAELVTAFLLWIIEAAFDAGDPEDYPALDKVHARLLRDHRPSHGALTAIRRSVMNEDNLFPPDARP